MIFVSDPMFHAAHGLPRHGLGKGTTRNRYMPHQGEKECARRVRQLGLGGADREWSFVSTGFSGWGL